MSAPMAQWRVSKMLFFRFFVLISSLCIICGDDEFEGLSVLTVEHSFDQGANPSYSKRGIITLQSLKAGSAHYTDEVSGLSIDDRETLKALVKKDGLYRVRLRQKSTENEDYLPSTFVKACSLYESHLSDILTVNVDQAGSVLGVSLTTISPYCHGIAVSDVELDTFNTSVEVVQTVNGPVPETQSYIHKLEQESAEKAKEQQPDNRSFFGKYWMYIVPVVLVMMLMSNADPGQQGGGGGGGR